VDSTRSSEDSLEAARQLATSLGTVVAVTGRTDYITDGSRVLAVDNGHALMARVTGMGCTASALVAAFLAVEPDAVLASARALVVLGLAGELAAERSPGPGSLQLHLLDTLYTLDEATVRARARVR
jgi:hydroxyethylthiazole kinase